MFKFLLSFFLLLSTTSSLAQKMVQRIDDAKKLQLNQKQFIGKPLNALLSQIVLEIKYVYGTPDNRSSGAVGGTYLKLFFVDRNEVIKEYNKNEDPTGITVRFQLEPNNNRKPIPVGGINITKGELLKEYGDMIVQSVYVSGQN